MSAYIRKLIRRRSETEIAEDVMILEKAIAVAPAGDPSEAELRQIYAVAKKGRKK